MKMFILSCLSFIALVSLAQNSDHTTDDHTMMTVLEWKTMTITNSATGEDFTLADFAGHTVFVEPFATWCGNCRRQLTNVSGALDMLDGENIVVIALSIGENASDQVLAEYAEANSFTNFVFASVTPELLTSLVNEFGRALTSPPSTPHFIINSDGSFSELDTGMESSEEILEQLNASLSSGSDS